jgi:hypothetical protein
MLIIFFYYTKQRETKGNFQVSIFSEKKKDEVKEIEPVRQILVWPIVLYKTIYTFGNYYKSKVRSNGDEEKISN